MEIRYTKERDVKNQGLVHVVGSLQAAKRQLEKLQKDISGTVYFGESANAKVSVHIDGSGRISKLGVATDELNSQTEALVADIIEAVNEAVTSGERARHAAIAPIVNELNMAKRMAGSN